MEKKNKGRLLYCVITDKYGKKVTTETIRLNVKVTPVSKCKFKLSGTAFTYNGSAKKPTVTVKNASGTKLTGLSAKKTYYVRIRTYKTVNGVKYYSGWTTIKYKKTK